MDAFNYMVTIVLMMLVMQFNMAWMAFGILFISIITSKDLMTVIVLLVTGGIIYYAQAIGLLNAYWPIILLVSIGLFYLFRLDKGSGGQPEMYNPDPFGGLMGGGV